MNTTDRIRSLVKSKGWSLREFFRRLDLNQSTMAAWEKGSASPDKHLNAIAAILNTTEEYLRGEIDDPSPFPGYAPNPVIVHNDPRTRKLMESAQTLTDEQLALVAGLIDSMAKQNEKRGNDE